MANLSDITVVSVSYNSSPVLPNMLASLPKTVRVVLVDNASHDTTKLKEIAVSHGAELVLNEVNRGFGVGCNLGATAAKTPYLLFLNPDTEVQPGALEALLEGATRYPDAAAFNPRLLDEVGDITLRRRSNLMPKRQKYRGPLPESDMELIVLSGAAIFVKAAVFDQVGGFDPQMFLYHEDDDIALRFKKLGPLMHIHAAVIRHVGGQSTAPSTDTLRFKAYHMARSRVYGKAKHGLPWPKAGTIWRGLRKLVSPAMRDPKYRAEHWGYFCGALSSLKDGGRYLGN